MTSTIYSSVLCMDSNPVIREYLEDNELNSQDQEEHVLIFCRNEFEEKTLVKLLDDLEVEYQVFEMITE